jgi:hypothetical protein
MNDLRESHRRFVKMHLNNKVTIPLSVEFRLLQPLALGCLTSI